MALVVTVQADSREECEAELARQCAAFGMRPILAPTCSAGTGRWMARATPTAPAEGEGRGVQAG
ncbi:hypothetical protein ABZ208_13790 [Streptomyces sp. NPDC006208]|uniref:hypothetical protein n=1 Tax=Streptomyces sp. NPDC006208 TaxID=3156734 RepID=UPI0033B4B0E9